MKKYDGEDTRYYSGLSEYSPGSKNPSISLNDLDAQVNSFRKTNLNVYECLRKAQLFDVLLPIHGVKTIGVLNKLCLKMANQGMGVNQLYLRLLQYSIRLGVERQTLPLVCMKILPMYGFQKHHIYLYFSALINLKLERERQAYLDLQQLIQRYQVLEGLMVPVLKYWVLVKKFLGLTLDQSTFLTLAKGHFSYNMHIISDFMLEPKDCSNPAQCSQAICECLHAIIKNNMKTTKRIQKFLINSSGMIPHDDPYVCIKLLKSSNKMRATGDEFIKYGVERIESDEIGGFPLRKLQNMEKMNTPDSIGRFDCEKGLLYFDHSNKGSKDHELISQCYQMDASIKQRQKEYQLKNERMQRMGRGGSIHGMFSPF